MTLLMQLRKDKMQALKDKDTIKNGVCSLLISAISLANKERGQELSDEEAMKFVQRELKQTKDTLAQTPENRSDLIEETKQKIAIIEAYLPKQMSDEEVRSAVSEIMQEKNLEASGKSRGILMKEMMSRYSGKTDGKTVSRIVQELLR